IWLAVLLAVVALPALHLARNWTPPSTPAPLLVSSDFEWEPGLRTAEPTARSILPVELPVGSVVWSLLALWLLGSTALLVKLSASYLYLRWLKSDSSPAGDPLARWLSRWRPTVGQGRTPITGVTGAVRLPVTAGLVRPAVLFPRKLLGSLSEQEAHDVWLHELAHVRRWDDWTKLGQKLAEAVLFFNPAVHWIGRRLNLQREMACDEWVVARTG
ncbi:MAG: M56 family metallopeptidase, partial [bacterium]|nr:M56 family metallopeptidase [bacterium]